MLAAERAISSEPENNVKASFCAGDEFSCVIFNNDVYYIYLVTLSTL